jgi:hypothetical protein
MTGAAGARGSRILGPVSGVLRELPPNIVTSANQIRIVKVSDRDAYVNQAKSHEVMAMVILTKLASFG